MILTETLSSWINIETQQKKKKKNLNCLHLCNDAISPDSKVPFLTHTHTDTRTLTHTPYMHSLQFLRRTLQSKNQQLSRATQSYQEVSNACSELTWGWFLVVSQALRNITLCVKNTFKNITYGWGKPHWTWISSNSLSGPLSLLWMARTLRLAIE